MAVVFLSSAIDGIPVKDRLDYYSRVESELSTRGHTLINPSKFYSDIINGSKGGSNSYSQFVVMQNLELLKNSQVVLIDFSNKNRQYIGCICEMVYAKLYGIPVIAFIDNVDHFMNRPYIIYHCAFIAKNWNEALDFISRLVG